MALQGIDQFVTDVRYDWTQHQQRPAKLQAAYDAMLSAWGDYMDATNTDVVVPGAVIQSMSAIARHADAEYRRLYRVWQASLEDCSCRPIDADRDYTCPACRAKAELDDDGEMPY